MIRSTDEEARGLGRALVRATPSAALATLSADGFPLATLTSVATDSDGAPLILVSRLSGHTTNLLADPRCSLLFARTGKGDPLAHPRLSLSGEAKVLERDSEAGRRARTRFLARQPKAALYVDFPDFLFLRVEPRGASLNGGFGKAYELTPADLLTSIGGAEALIEAEPGILAHMNEDHADTLALFAVKLGRREEAGWRMVSVDPEGFEIAAAGELVRLGFEARAETPDAVRGELMKLAKAARAA